MPISYSLNPNSVGLLNVAWVQGGQGVKARMLGRQNERNFCYVRLALTSIFGLCFVAVCLIKPNCYSLKYSSLEALVSEFISKYTQTMTGSFIYVWFWISSTYLLFINLSNQHDFNLKVDACAFIKFSIQNQIFNILQPYLRMVF